MPKWLKKCYQSPFLRADSLFYSIAPFWFCASYDVSLSYDLFFLYQPNDTFFRYGANNPLFRRWSMFVGVSPKFTEPFDLV